MLYALGFERVGPVVGDLLFVDPGAREGQEGAEYLDALLAAAGFPALARAGWL